jgi:hypothetical protein
MTEKLPNILIYEKAARSDLRLVRCVAAADRMLMLLAAHVASLLYRASLCIAYV